MRVDESFQPLLAHWIEGDDLDPAPRGVLQRMQKARTVRPRILPEEGDRIAFGEIVVNDCADTDPDRLFQRDRGRLVAHVRTVRKVVAAKQAREQSVEIRRLQARATGRIEDDGLRIERLQFLGDRLESFVQFTSNIFVGLLIVAQRMRQLSLLLQIVVAPAAQFCERVPGKKCWRAAAARELPKRRLRAVLTELERMIVRGLGPRAGNTHETLGLVLAQQRLSRQR